MRIPLRRMTSRIVISGAVLEASRYEQGAFARAVDAEWAAVVELSRRQLEYELLKDTNVYHHHCWDEDLEVDIGL